ncbi:uncharacterized protein LOC141917589 isoform X1 [Strix aluco]|uniref:uncharacterized protein LOC141917589 isoform X1 n=1 Tax=Strix aluco TaxID=111821 RepID=UPI003DA3C0D0
MAFTLYSLLQAVLLIVNAVAVLHEERFLRHVGWGSDQGMGGFGEEPEIKTQLTNLIRSVQTVMRDDDDEEEITNVNLSCPPQSENCAINSSELRYNCSPLVVWLKIPGENLLDIQRNKLLTITALSFLGSSMV